MSDHSLIPHDISRLIGLALRSAFDASSITATAASLLITRGLLKDDVAILTPNY
jgi:hypothetical protein